jgi:Na+/H+ antiporter NhaD/arsenite permease-like protein
MVLWMGSIPNIIIGLEAGLSFMDFVMNVMPLGVILYLVTLVVFIRMFKSDYTPEPEEEFRDLEFDEWIERAIEVSGLHTSRVNVGMITAAIIMILTIVGFAVYESFNMTPAFVALFCGFLMMLSQTRDPSVIMREIDLSTILFLAGMFIMINGLGKVGIIEALSQSLFAVLGSSPLRASVILMWLSGVISSVVDNIPVATSLSPIVRDMVVDKSWEILWWGLVIGANLGGCMTPIGSQSNVIAMGVSEQEGYPIPFNQFLKLGVMLTILYFIISMIYIYVRYGLLGA